MLPTPVITITRRIRILRARESVSKQLEARPSRAIFKIGQEQIARFTPSTPSFGRAPALIPVPNPQPWQASTRSHAPAISFFVVHLPGDASFHCFYFRTPGKPEHAAFFSGLALLLPSYARRCSSHDLSETMASPNPEPSGVWW